MNSYTDKIQQNKKQSTPYIVSQKKNNSTTLSYRDNSSAAITQMQLQEIANNSLQVKQAVHLQTMANANSSLPIQRKGIEEEELQMKTIPIQKQGVEEEELQMKAIPIQKKSIEEEELQMKTTPIQKKGIEEEELQMKAIPIQKKGIEKKELLQGKFSIPIQKKENNTGLPDNLKSGIENLSGYSMDDVKVHYNSDKPAELQAHAYAQGTDIHIASGQEKHLPHEAWHVVQQKQGRVQPTLQMKGKVNINDDTGLEDEADVMGTRAVQMLVQREKITSELVSAGMGGQSIVQREYAEATCTVAGHAETVSSKGVYVPHWVSDAMNTVASVQSKLVPSERDGEWVEVAGNAKLQCAEPKSLSRALRNGLNKNDQITEEELVGIQWTEIKWKEGHRDNDPACPCPTCQTWMTEKTGSAEPLGAALDAVRVAGTKNGKYFENNDARGEFNEKQRLAAEVAQRKIDEYETYGKYMKVLSEAGCDEPYHEMRDRVDSHRERLSLYIEKNNELEAKKTRLSQLEMDIKSSNQKQKKALKLEKDALAAKVEKLENEQAQIIELALA